MTTFNRVDPRKLTLGKTYLVLEKINDESIYLFKGKIEKLISLICNNKVVEYVR